MGKGVYDTNSPHFKGTFLTIYAVNQKYPAGGVDGDWCLINGWVHYWDADRGTWCVNSQRDTYWDELFSGVKFNTENIMKKYEYLLFDLSKKANTSDVQASLEELKKEIGDRTVVEGNVTNLPDEEDITSGINESGTDVLSLKDRVYNPLSFSGKGYKILRKNIKPVSLAVTKIIVGSIPTVDGAIVFTINGVEVSVDMVTTTMTSTDLVAQKIAEKLTATMIEYEVSKDASTITLTRKFGGEISTPSSFSAVNTGVSCTITDSTKKELRNILTQNMINQPNTIYEIRYDFDLYGEAVELPGGCTLKFEGGSLNNGSILNKVISWTGFANKVSENLIFKGETTDSYINVKNVCPLYGRKSLFGDGRDETENIQELFKLGKTLFFPKGIYAATHLYLYECSIKGASTNDTIFKCIDEEGKTFDNEKYNPFFELWNVARHVTFENFTVVYDGICHRSGFLFKAYDTKTYSTGGLWQSTLRNLNVSGFTGNCMAFDANNKDYGYDVANQFLYINSCSFAGAGNGDDKNAVIKAVGQLDNVTFENCQFFKENIKEGDKVLNLVSNSCVYLEGTDPSNDTCHLVFINCSFVECGYTAINAGMASIHTYSCKFENLGRIVHIRDNRTYYYGTNNIALNITSLNAEENKNYSYFTDFNYSCIIEKRLFSSIVNGIFARKANTHAYVYIDEFNPDGTQEFFENYETSPWFTDDDFNISGAYNETYNNLSIRKHLDSILLPLGSLTTLSLVDHSSRRNLPTLFVPENMLEAFLLYPSGKAVIRKDVKNLQLISVHNPPTQSKYLIDLYSLAQSDKVYGIKVYCEDINKEVIYTKKGWCDSMGNTISTEV